MELHSLNKLAEKFWKGDCTEAEEQQLKIAIAQGKVPKEHQALAEYFAFMEQETNTKQLDDDFDLEMLAMIQEKPVRTIRFKPLMKIAASIAFVVSVSWGIHQGILLPTPQEEITAEFVDTYEDSEIAYQEVKKALMLVSANMNEGLEHTEHLGKFHEAQLEVGQGM